jgi:TPR repeat protein
MADYGWCLLNAIEVESHRQNGLHYIRRVANSNDRDGLYYLGMIRLLAIHSFEDKEKAFRLFQRATSFGHVESIYTLESVTHAVLAFKKTQ